MKLRAGAAHVWRVDLDALPREIEDLLDSGERERASRIVRESARARWMAARGALRALLGHCLNADGQQPQIDPTALRIATEPGGKPVLDLPRAERLHFNLSHSGGLAVYALTKLGPVGIDVELVSRRPNAPKRGREQLRAWVSYEAEVKRTGAGIAGGVDIPEGALIAGGATPSVEPSGWIVELDVGSDAVAALALAEEAEVVFESAAVLERQLGGDLLQARSGAVAL